jgi:hypothetical protein
LLGIIFFHGRYSTCLANSNVPLASSLILHLGDISKEDFVLLETHNGDGRVAELILKNFPSILYHGCDFSSQMNNLCQERIKDIPVKNVPKVLRLPIFFADSKY